MAASPKVATSGIAAPMPPYSSAPSPRYFRPARAPLRALCMEEPDARLMWRAGTVRARVVSRPHHAGKRHDERKATKSQVLEI